MDAHDCSLCPRAGLTPTAFQAVGLSLDSDGVL
jgi:hypothetical protein